MLLHGWMLLLVAHIFVQKIVGHSPHQRFYYLIPPHIEYVMSQTQIGIEDTEQVVFQYCKFGPLTEPYVNGGSTEVDRVIDGEEKTVRRGAFTDLDGKYNGDYTVGYVASPVLGFHMERGDTHEQLKAALKEIGLWQDSYRPVDIPTTNGDGQPVYDPGYISLPEMATRHRFESYADRLRTACEDLPFESDHMVFEGDNGINVALPVPQHE